MAIGSGWLNNLQGVYHQANIFDNGRTYDTNRRGQAPGVWPTSARPTTPAPGGGGARPPAPSPSPTLPPRYTAPAPYVPKFIAYDYNANFNRARQQAEQAVNPLYEKMINQFVGRQQALEQERRTQTAMAKETNALDLSQALAGNQVNRARTIEDEQGAQRQLTEAEAAYQQESGTAFDEQRRATAEQVAASGTTASGVGQGVIFSENNKRNLSEAAQVKEYGNQREAKKLFASRTIEDLNRNDENTRKITENKDKAADFDLESYLQELAYGRQEFEMNTEKARLEDVAGQTQTYANANTSTWLQSLAGQGYNAADIANAYAMYG